MKICFVATTYPRHPKDGAGRFNRSLAEAMAKAGHEVHVLAPYHPTVAPIAGAVQIHHFHYVKPDSLAIMGYAEAMHSDTYLRRSAYALTPLFALAELTALAWLTRKHRFDVIHAHWVIPNGWIAAWVAQFYGVPLFITLHGSDIFFARKQKLLGMAARSAFAKAAAVITCSPDLAEGALQLGADKAKTYVLPWVGDLAVFARPAGKQRENLWSIPIDRPVVLTLARLVRKKGIHKLLEAMPTILQQCPNALCVIAGDGPELGALQAQAETLQITEQVRFVGAVAWDDVPELHACSDVFVLPSARDENGNSDGLPTTVLEAMAAGKAVVASKIGGLPMVVQAGKSGLLVEEGNVAALAAALTLLLRDRQLAKEYGVAGQERIRTELNWGQFAQWTTEIYAGTFKAKETL